MQRQYDTLENIDSFLPCLNVQKRLSLLEITLKKGQENKQQCHTCIAQGTIFSIFNGKEYEKLYIYIYIYIYI